MANFITQFFSHFRFIYLPICLLRLTLSWQFIFMTTRDTYISNVNTSVPQNSQNACIGQFQTLLMFLLGLVFQTSGKFTHPSIEYIFTSVAVLSLFFTAPLTEDTWWQWYSFTVSTLFNPQYKLDSLAKCTKKAEHN